MAKVIPNLHLNVNPSKVEDYNLVNAKNIITKDDGTVICPDYVKGVTRKYKGRNGHIVTQKLYKYFDTLFGEDNSKYDEILSAIPCSKEIIFFVQLVDNPGYCDLIRYNEDTEATKLYKFSEPIYGVNVEGTFTYNVNGELIISFCAENDVMKTINLDEYDDTEENENDLIINSKFPIIPEVILPSFKEFNYVTGSSIRGVYYAYIRYKINKYDYTQWYSIGYPINMSYIEDKEIYKYNFCKGGNNDVLNFSLTDEYADKKDLVNSSFNILFENLNTANYNYYQIGFLILRKDYKKIYVSGDLSIDKTDIIFNTNDFKEDETQKLNTTFYNYYDVKNIANYKNKLYISNYSESKIDLKEFSNKVLSRIKNDVAIGFKLVNRYDTKYEIEDKKYSRQYKINFTYIEDDESEEYEIEVNDYGLINAYELLKLINPNIEDVEVKWDVYIYYSNEGRRNIKNTGSLLLSDIYIEIVKDYYQNEHLDIEHAFRLRTKDSLLSEYYANPYYSISSKYINTVNFEIHTLNDVLFNTEFLKTLFIENNKNYKPNTNLIISNLLSNKYKINTLIPGEIYNFYIHFVDKYGIASDGYNIPAYNHTYFGLKNPLIFKLDFRYKTLIIEGDDEIIYYDGGEIYLNINKYNIFGIDEHTREKVVLNDNDINEIKSKLDCFKLNKYDNYYWSDVLININDITVLKDGVRYYKTRHVNLYENYTEGANNYIKFNSLELEIYETLTNILQDTEYIGWFISYEQFNTDNKQSIALNKIITYNENETLELKSCILDEFDILDNIKLSHEFYIEQSTGIDLKIDNGKVIDTKENLILDYAKPFNYKNIAYKKLLPANVKNNLGFSTSLLIIENTEDYGLYTKHIIDNEDTAKFDIENTNIYINKLLTLNNDYYKNKNKKLIRATDVCYDLERDYDHNNPFITNNCFNGHITNNNNIFYNLHTVFDSARNMAQNMFNTDFYSVNNYFDIHSDTDPKGINKLFICSLKNIIYDTYHHEDKIINNEPLKVQQNLTKGKTGKEGDVLGVFKYGTIVIPDNTIDLFKNDMKIDDSYNIKTYINYSLENINKTRFDNTIRRSYVISDESLENNWRKFDTDDYLNVTYNKGKIVKLIPSASTFLIHTEHMLFVLDVRNFLQNSENATIQVDDKDVFETKIKELFSNELGYGGLKDKYNSINGEYGYVWFDEDSKHFYRLDSSDCKEIDRNIYNLISLIPNFKINNIAEDKANYRLVFSIKDKMLSLCYNYKTNAFESFNSAYFEKAWNTKQTSYYINIKYIKENNEIVRTEKKLFNFVSDIFNGKNTIVYPYNYSDNYFEFIVNTNYNVIKFIEYIRYRISTCYDDLNNTKIENYDNILSNLIEFNKDLNNFKDLNYAGDEIKIYNDIIDTNNIDLTLDEEDINVIDNNYEGYINENTYAKPYKDLGWWNLAILRDKNNTSKSQVELEDKHSRLYGNYFIIRFWFEDEVPYIFENIDIKLITERT